MNTIKFKSRDELIRVGCADIIYFKADGNYSTMILVSGKEYLLTMNLSKVTLTLETQLGVQSTMFERVGRNLIIQTAYIFSIHILKKQLILTNPESHICIELQASKQALRQLKGNYDKQCDNQVKLQLRELQTLRTYPISIGNNTFGRHSNKSNCTFQINNGDSLMSRNHFSISLSYGIDNEGYMIYVTDMQSSNGTFVNNTQRVDTERPQHIQVGDVIRAGKTEFVIEYLDFENTDLV